MTIMIELTDEQAKIMESWGDFDYWGEDKVIEITSLVDKEHLLRDVTELLTKSQIKQLAEQHGMSCVEWVEFDADNKNTHPKPNTDILGCRAKDSAIDIYEDDGSYEDTLEFFLSYDLEKWCELPKPMESE